MSRAASPRRGRSSRLTEDHRRAEEQLPDPTGVRVTGVPAASTSASLPWEGRKDHPSAPVFPGGPRSLPAAPPEACGCSLGSGPWARVGLAAPHRLPLVHRKPGPGQASPGEDGGPVSMSDPRGQGWSLVTEQLPSTRQEPRGRSPLAPWPCTHREGLDPTLPHLPLCGGLRHPLFRDSPRPASERFSPVTSRCQVALEVPRCGACCLGCLLAPRLGSRKGGRRTSRPLGSHRKERTHSAPDRARAHATSSLELSAPNREKSEFPRHRSRACNCLAISHPDRGQRRVRLHFLSREE